jgi:hypothetical protein
MQEIINKWPIISQIVIYVMAFNAFMVGLKLALDKIKDSTASNWDNKASEVIGKIVDMINYLIDIISANPKH